jgi:hypothetical protein
MGGWVFLWDWRKGRICERRSMKRAVLTLLNWVVDGALLHCEAGQIGLHAGHHLRHPGHLVVERVEGRGGVGLVTIQTAADGADVAAHALPSQCFLSFIIRGSGEGVVLTVSGGISGVRVGRHGLEGFYCQIR